MRFDLVPMPPDVAARPRDARGYPVPAITPWAEDQPQFALTDYGRSAECATGRLCSVCGELMPRGPVWRVVGAAESAAISEARAAGRPTAIWPRPRRGRGTVPACSTPRWSALTWHGPTPGGAWTPRPPTG
ncbi:hypothetical protein ACFQZC_27285 [Streptacidiphilus monticola]